LREDKENGILPSISMAVGLGKPRNRIFSETAERTKEPSLLVSTKRKGDLRKRSGGRRNVCITGRWLRGGTSEKLFVTARGGENLLRVWGIDRRGGLGKRDFVLFQAEGRIGGDAVRGGGGRPSVSDETLGKSKGRWLSPCFRSCRKGAVVTEDRSCGPAAVWGAPSSVGSLQRERASQVKICLGDVLSAVGLRNRMRRERSDVF